MEILIFSELISSNCYFIHLSRHLNILNQYIGLGLYLQGIPISNATDFFWGTNAGVRTVPLLSLLTIFERIFGSYGAMMYLTLTLTLPLISFIIANKILKNITLFTLIGAIFYGSNLWIINRIFTGFWQLNIVYAFLPFLVTIPIKITDESKLPKESLIFYTCAYALFASIIITSQPHFLIIIGIFSFFHFFLLIIRRRTDAVFSLLKLYSLTGVIILILNAYFFFPGIFFPEVTFTAPNQYFSIGSVLFNSQGNLMQHVLRFDPLGPSQNVFTWTTLEILQFLPIILVCFLFIKMKNKNYLFIFLILIFILFAKGINPPGEAISTWVYKNIFFMHYFRDPSRFLAGAVLFSSLIVSSFQINRKIPIKYQVGILLSVLLFFVYINSKSFLPPKINYLKEDTIPDSYILMQEYINNHLPIDDSTRLITIPNSHGLSGYSWYDNPHPNTSNTIFDYILPLNIPSANSSTYPDTFSSQISAYLYTKFNQSYDSSALRPLSVGHILTDSNIISPLDEKNISTQSAQLFHLNHYSLLYNISNLSLFKVATTSSLVSTEQPIFAIGNFSTIATLSQHTTRPIILLNQQIHTSLSMDKLLKDKAIYIDTDHPTLSLAGERLAKKYSVDILSAGWNYDQIFGNYEPYKMKYIKQSGELFTSGRSVINNPNLSSSIEIEHSLKNGRYIILTKALSKDSTTMTLTAGNLKKDIHLNTKESLIWTNNGSILIPENVDKITLESPSNSPLIIDFLLFVPEQEYKKNIKYVGELLDTMNKYQLSESATLHTNSQYDITVDTVRLENPTQYLTYNFSYGEHWNANTRAEKFISNGYGMTFISSNKNISQIEYTPNKYYKISLAISGVTLVCILIYLGIGIKRRWH